MISFKQLGKLGRTGNCLFEIAATVALAKRNNDSYIFPPWQDAKYFRLENCFLNNIKHIHNYEEPCYAYRPIPYKPNLNIHGYFQSEKYFVDFADEVRTLLTPRTEIVKRKNVASIHVRRTDYLKFPKVYPLCNMQYYQKAMELVGADKFLVFSDDMRWCKAHFTGNNFEFSEGNLPHVDLGLMIGCEHHITANSSFSWWGAWLDPNLQKTVVSPKQWFGSAMTSSHPIDDLIPSDWELI